MATFEEIRPLIEAKVTELGLELYDIHHAKSGNHSLLRIYIDKEGGVTVADCEKVSHALSLLLDVEEFSNTSYRLEVSSPGLDRVLKSERDFVRFKGKKVIVHYHKEDPKIREIHGTVLDCKDGVLSLTTKNGVETIALAEIQHAKLELDF